MVTLRDDGRPATAGFRLLALIDRLVDALTDPARRERTAITVIAAYGIVWTLYGVIAQSGQAVHYDSAQWVAFSREPSLGYWWHPPFCAWLVGAWFAVFPVADWAYYLLCITLASITLMIGWCLFEGFLDPLKRVVALALLTFIPFFNFLALKYDHDFVLMPLWAATTLCFLRSYQTRSIGWAALAGAGAAAAMLTKYWSIFLLVGLAAAALLDPKRRAYFRSPAPWVTMALGTAILMPHVVWLVANDFLPFTYASTDHRADSLARAVVRAAFYLGGGAGYVALPVVLVFAASRPGAKAFADMLWPSTPERWFAAVVYWLALLAPVLVAIITLQELEPTWVMSGLILLPVVLLSSPLVSLDRTAVRAIVGLAVALPLVLVAASPGIAIAIQMAGHLEPKNLYVKQLAVRVGQEWRRSTDQPLRIVGGDVDLTWLMVFYRPELPSAFPALNRAYAPWVDDARIAREGVALVCLLAEAGDTCHHEEFEAANNAVVTRNPASRRIYVELAKTYLGIESRPARFRIIIVPPQR